MKIPIAVVDDHPLVAHGITNILTSSENFEIVATASHGRQFLNIIQIIDTLPEIVVMDIDMPVMNGLETARILRQDYPLMKIVMLSIHDENIYYNKAIAAQADGYVMKSANKGELMQALSEVKAGKKYFCKPLPKTRHNDISVDHASLTVREIDVLKKIAGGLSNAEISESLGISIRTVDTHRTNLKRKLCAHNIAGLVRYAFHQGYLS